MLKKSSMSGDAKNGSGVDNLCNEKSERTLLAFFGAGGHTKISGIRNLEAFGVHEGPVEIEPSPPPSSITSFFGESLELVEKHLEPAIQVDISFALFCRRCFFVPLILDSLILLLLLVIEEVTVFRPQFILIKKKLNKLYNN